MSETDGMSEAERLADEMHDEVVRGAWVDWEIASATEMPGAPPLTETQRTYLEFGIELGYQNTLRALVRRGLLKAAQP